MNPFDPRQTPICPPTRSSHPPLIRLSRPSYSALATGAAQPVAGAGGCTAGAAAVPEAKGGTLSRPRCRRRLRRRSLQRACARRRSARRSRNGQRYFLRCFRCRIHRKTRRIPHAGRDLRLLPRVEVLMAILQKVVNQSTDVV